VRSTNEIACKGTISKVVINCDFSFNAPKGSASSRGLAHGIRVVDDYFKTLRIFING